MKFRIVDEHWAVSECGYYTLSKGRSVNGELSYTAWYRIDGRPSSQTNKASVHLGEFISAKFAQDACVRHKRQSTTQPRQSAA
jgi:hypothetical protein